jgi:hypothetical protein
VTPDALQDLFSAGVIKRAAATIQVSSDRCASKINRSSRLEAFPQVDVCPNFHRFGVNRPVREIRKPSAVTIQVPSDCRVSKKHCSVCLEALGVIGVLTQICATGNFHQICVERIVCEGLVLVAGKTIKVCALRSTRFRVTGVGRPLRLFCFRGLKSAESVRQ